MSEHATIHINRYLMVFASLGALTILTVTAGYLPLPTGIGIIIALVIASVKGSLVAAFFMHLVGESKPIVWVLLLTFFFLMSMIILFALFAIDQTGVRYVS